MESAIVGGDLARLTPEQRTELYQAICKSLGLNPLTNPFGYITLNNKLVLYAKKDCTEQLRRIHGVSVTNLKKVTTDGIFEVDCEVTNREGRTDQDIGTVTVKGLSGDLLCNARMKCVTKAKRRATLSICGLGMLDETEIETIRDAKAVETMNRAPDNARLPPPKPLKPPTPKRLDPRDLDDLGEYRITLNMKGLAGTLRELAPTQIAQASAALRVWAGERKLLSDPIVADHLYAMEGYLNQLADQGLMHSDGAGPELEREEWELGTRPLDPKESRETCETGDLTGE